MKITITKCIHVTQTERRHLSAFFQSGLIQAKINTKFYTVLTGSQGKDNSWDYKVSIMTPYTNDNGQKDYNKQTIELNVIKT
jgi:hypothetical protein